MTAAGRASRRVYGLAFLPLTVIALVLAAPAGTPGRLLWVAGALSIGVVAYGLSNRKLFASAFWLALALAGQAAQLHLIDAGPLLHYQHYRPLGEMTERSQFPATLLLLIQAVLVGLGLFSRFGAIAAWLKSTFRPWQIAAIALAFAGSAATVSRDLHFYAAELGIATFIQFVNLGNLVLVGWCLPEGTLASAGGRWREWFGSANPVKTVRVDRFAVVIAVWVTTICALLSAAVYQRHPHVADEVVYLLNARYFAAGMAVMPPPPDHDGFDIDLTNYEEKQWFCAVPPGWPAVLAIGAWLGAPSMVNPVLSGINILLAYLLLWRLYSRGIARLSIVLLAVSPWYLFMGMNFMTHTLTTFCALAAAWGLVLARERQKPAWALIAGVAAGYGTVVRPLDGLIVVAVIGLWAIGAGGKRLKFVSLAALGAGTVLGAATQLPYNKLLSGDMTVNPLMSYTDKYYGRKSNAYGFGPERGLGWALDPYPGHTPFESLINADLNLSSINYELFGWSAGSVLLIALTLFSGKLRGADYGMAAIILLVFLLYAGYWYSGGPDFGARYWYLMLIPCVALTARGVEVLIAALEPARKAAGIAAAVTIGLLCAITLLNYLPWRSADKYYHFLRMMPDVRELAREHQFGGSLVLVRGERFPDYASAAIYNPLDLRAPAPVYAWDRNAATRSRLLAAYPDRPVWVLEGPGVTHAGYRVAAGPLSHEAAMRLP